MNRNIDFIPFALPSLGTEEENAVLRVLRSGWLTTGKETKSFESEFADTIGIREAVSVNSATAGLHLALEALGIGRGDRVITSPYTFTATAEVTRYLGAHPVFVDIEEDSFNIDPDLLEKEIRKWRRKPKAVIPIHIGGHPCRMNEIMRIAKAKNMAVVEDAAHAFPVPTQEGYLGTVGDVGVFSFYATKTITTGEGGMVVTSRADLAERIRIMRLHGIDREIWDRYTSKKPSWKYAVVDAGFKYNLTDLASAIGREQLKKAFVFREERARIATEYTVAFRDRDYIILPPASDNHAWHLYILRLVPELLSITRDEFIEELSRAGIGTSVHYIPLHIMPYYREKYGLKPDDFPRSLSRFRQVVSLPIYPGMTEVQIQYILKTVLRIGDNHYRRSVNVDKYKRERHPEGSGAVH